MTPQQKILCFAICITTFSCKKNDIAGPIANEANYTITLSGQWRSANFTVPSGAHFTVFAGMVHNGDIKLWEPGSKASTGVRNMAEIGYSTTILAEIDSSIAIKKASALVAFNPPAITGTIDINFYCNSNYSHLSFMSMLGPTPDWFTGISDLNLYNNGKWISDTTLQLYVYDAGTEEGDVFGYDNAATAPQQNIHLLQAASATVLANGNNLLKPIATARLVKK